MPKHAHKSQTFTLLLLAGLLMVLNSVCATPRYLAYGPQQGGNDPFSPSELQQLDARIESGPRAFQAEIKTVNIKTRDIYKAYLIKASTLTRKLTKIKSEADKRQDRFSLQRLAAMTHALSMENTTFRGTFEHGEDKFYSYQLIEKAVTSMEDAVSYWRQSNQTRQLYRGSALDKVEDDEILKLKLQAAFSAIEQLKGIENVRQVLDKNLQEDLLN